LHLWKFAAADVAAPLPKGNHGAAFSIDSPRQAAGSCQRAELRQIETNF
jgi:hypothetical protein